MKRTLDILVATFGLVLLSPLFVYIAWRIKRNLGSPILFYQMRPGRNGEQFQMIKFRTMRNVSGPDGLLLPDAKRLSPFGTKLRLTSADELPELWNVLKGEMSLVGPRPLLMEYLPLYSNEQKRRHDVRPGITGWAQINGRNAVSWEQKFAFDLWYVDNRTIWLDFKIICMTFKKVLNHEGILEEREVPKFTGKE